MYPFTKQVQSVCDSAKFCAAYLSGQTAPKHEDTETTSKQLHERIGKIVQYLEGFKTSDFAKIETIQVKLGWAGGKWISGDEYLNYIVIPNFYFHMMTCYAILRHVGVDIGKYGLSRNGQSQRLV